MHLLVLGMAGVLIIYLVPVNHRIKIYPIHRIRGERDERAKLVRGEVEVVLFIGSVL